MRSNKSLWLVSVFVLVLLLLASGVSATSAIQVEDAPPGTTVFKQPGDFVNIFVWSGSIQDVYLDYDSGIGYTGEFDTVTLNTGRNVLKFYIFEDTSPGTYDIEVGSADFEVEVINNPSLVIITNRKKLFQRYGEDPGKRDGRVDELLAEAYKKAKEQRGIVYDLGVFDSMPDFPWASFSEYSEEPLNSKMTDNSYAVAAGIFVESKCRSSSCKNVLVLGDDFVIPHYRRSVTLTEGWFWWKKEKTETIYTDLSYIPVNRKPFSELDELFDRTSVIIVKPRSASTELEQEIIDLEEEIVEKYGNVGVSVISDHKITCNSFAELGGGSIFAKNLILVGDDTNNRAIACLPWVGGVDSVMSIERNVWDFHGHTVVLETDGQRLDTIQTFRKILPMPDKSIFDFGRAVTACLWDGKFEGEGALGQEIACNMIPVVELAPDFRDSFKCWMESEETAVDELVCGINHFATGYDLFGYGAALLSFGVGGVVAEVGDSGVAVIKTTFKKIAKEVVDPKIIDTAATAFKKGKKLKLVGGLIGMVARNPKESRGLIDAWITVLAKGDDVAVITFKGISKGAVAANPSLVKKAGDYVEGIKLAKYADPFEDVAGIHKVERALSAPGVVTHVVDDTGNIVKSIDGMAVMKVGDGKTWGFDHIFKQARDGIPGNTRAKQVMDKFPQFKNNDDILDGMDTILRTGTKDGSIVKKTFIDNEGYSRYLEVWLADNAPGSINTLVIGNKVT